VIGKLQELLWDYGSQFVNYFFNVRVVHLRHSAMEFSVQEILCSASGKSMSFWEEVSDSTGSDDLIPFSESIFISDFVFCRN
jgi:hypothetical protein